MAYTPKTQKAACLVTGRGDTTGGKFSVCCLNLQLTRRCNMVCAHCSKGPAQAVDMSRETIDQIMDQISLIYCLALAGGEITLVPEVFRDVLESVKEHNVIILRLLVTTNGLIESREFLDIYRDFMDYVRLPGQSSIIISQDRFHAYAGNLTDEDYDEREKFFSDGGKNDIIFQNAINEGGLKRWGNCSKMPDSPKTFNDIDWDDLREKTFAYTMSKPAPKLKRPFRHYGKHLCNFTVTVFGDIVIDDLLPYEDEDRGGVHGRISEKAPAGHFQRRIQ